MWKKCLSAMILALLCALPSWCQQMTLADALAGKTAPPALKLKDLNAGWLRFSLDASGDPMSSMLPLMMMGGGDETAALLAGMNTGVYYTRGEVVTIGGTVFLAAYAAQLKILSRQDIDAMMNEDRRPDPLTPETPLSLSLLNLRTCGNLLNFQPFDLVRETTVVRLQEDINQETTTRLRQLAIAVLMYVQDNDNKYPPMRTTQELQAAIQDYVGNERVFLHPETKEPFLHNPKLDRVPEDRVELPTETVLWYEATPAPDGTRGVAFADGHAKRMPEEEWQQLKRKAGIP